MNAESAPVRPGAADLLVSDSQWSPLGNSGIV